jgi:hypothetical protein
VSAESRYVVRRLNWKSPTAGRYVRLPGWTEVAVCDAAETADAERRRREQEVRAAVNPFACAGSFFELTSLPGPVLADWLMDGGLEPPAPAAPFAEWRAWWDVAAPAMTAAERAHAWAGFDKLRFYDAAERPGAVVHVVLGVHWERDPERDVWTSPFEGGHPLRAFRSVAAAEAERMRNHEFFQVSLPTEDDYPPGYALVGARAEAGRDPFFDHRAGETEVTAADRPLADTVTVPVVDDVEAVRAAVRMFLVQRLSWTWHDTEGAIVWSLPRYDLVTTLRWMAAVTGNTSISSQLRNYDRVDGLPVVGQLSRKAAESLAWELDFVARTHTNPFRFGHPSDLTSVNEVGFRAALRVVGLEGPSDSWPLPLGFADRFEPPRLLPAEPWEDWWAATADGMSATQRETVWDLLDQLRFHQVVELELRD